MREKKFSLNADLRKRLIAATVSERNSVPDVTPLRGFNRPLALPRGALRSGAADGGVPVNYLLVDVKSQTLFLIHGQKVKAVYPISTSKFGTGSRKNSFKTPLGIHQIVKKIGANAPWGRIFKDRRDMGKNWDGQTTDKNLILSRILRLAGLEPGINQGGKIDTFKRYIYIHGTNHEQSISKPASHGCILMKNKDIIELFDKIPEKTIAIIR
ncbi:MAG: L,D-transpeptidase [Elusimicrobia bacterium]|nr:L,D-transpeptidase [Elusimicrobiota bacterium]